MISSDERRELAHRLREHSGAKLFTGDDVERLIGAEPSGFRPKDADTNYNLLADLIDRPTCHDVGGSYEFRCSVCGCVIHIFRDGGFFGDDDSAMTIGGDSLYVPRYCPNCGATVVEEGGCDVREL